MENLGVVSVIVPIYNVEKDLHRCIDSLQNQTYPYLEIILVDDGSPDKCGEICDTYAARDSRMKVIHKQNAGVGMARNSGLDIAAGEYVLFVDPDDYVADIHVERLLRVITEENADMVVGGHVRIFSDGKTIVRPTGGCIQTLEGNQIINAALLPILGAEPDAAEDVDREMSVWSNIYRRSLIEELHLRFLSEREIVSEDLFFNIHYIVNANRIVMIPDCNYFYAENVESLTHTYRADRFEKYCKMFCYEVELLKTFGVFEAANLRVCRTFIMKSKKCIALIACRNMKWNQKWRECQIILKNDLFNEVLKAYMGHVKDIRQLSHLYLLRNHMIIPLVVYYRLKYR